MPEQETIQVAEPSLPTKQNQLEFMFIDLSRLILLNPYTPIHTSDYLTHLCIFKLEFDETIFILCRGLGLSIVHIYCNLFYFFKIQLLKFIPLLIFYYFHILLIFANYLFKCFLKCCVFSYYFYLFY